MVNKEKLQEIISHLVEDEKPSIYLNKMKDSGELKEYPFNFIEELEDIPQSKEYHPEGNVWIHTMLVVDRGATVLKEVMNKEAFMMGLLLHDIGKRETTKIRKGRITSYDHDKVGEIKGREFLNSFNLSEEFKEGILYFIRYHMHLLFITKNLPYGNVKAMMEKERYLKDLSNVFLCDRLGRGNLNKSIEEDVRADIDYFKKEYIK